MDSPCVQKEEAEPRVVDSPFKIIFNQDKAEPRIVDSPWDTSLEQEEAEPRDVDSPCFHKEKAEPCIVDSPCSIKEKDGCTPGDSRVQPRIEKVVKDDAADICKDAKDANSKVCSRSG